MKSVLTKGDGKTVKKGEVLSCIYIDKWMHPMSKKFIYYHEVVIHNGDVVSIGVMEQNSKRIELGATIYYTLKPDGKATLITSSNDNQKSNSSESNQTKETNTEKETKKEFVKSAKVKGQEAFLGYAWSYAKDFVIAGKTMKDVKELNDVARYIYDEIGKMLNNN